MDEDIKKLLEENLAITKETHQLIKKIYRHIIWQRVAGLVYLILIVGPIILAVIYLPPVIGPMLRQYQQILGGLSQQQSGFSAAGGVESAELGNLKDILDNLQKNTGQN